jgi:Tol biopolymer transport system component
MTLAGSHSHELRSQGGFTEGPRFSPDGHRILYYVHQGPSDGVYVMNADGSGQRQLTTDGGINPTFSPNGRQIAYASTGLTVAGADGSGARNILTNARTDTPIDSTNFAANLVEYNEPEFSPDGHRIVLVKFTATGTGDCIDGRVPACIVTKTTSKQNQLEIVNTDGSGVHQLTAGPDDEAPSWSPDGSEIAYYKQAPGKSVGVGSIWVIKPNGSGNHEIALGNFPYWSTVTKPIPSRPRINFRIIHLNPGRKCFNPFTDGFGASVSTKASKVTGYDINVYIDGRLWAQTIDGRDITTEPRGHRGRHRIKVVVSDFALHDRVSKTTSWNQC